MSLLKKYKLVHETPAHFVLHDGQSHFHIAKKGLDKEAIGRIKGLTGEEKHPEGMDSLARSSMKDPGVTSLAKGGDVKHYDEGTDDVMDTVSGYIKSAFKTPAPKAAPVQSQEDKYEAIRKQNHQNMVTGQGGYNLAEGTASVPAPPAPTSDAQESMRKAFHFSEGGQVDHNNNPKEMEAETKELNTNKEHALLRDWMNKNVTPPQNFAEGTLGISEDTQNKINSEKEKLAIDQTAMPPQSVDNNNILPATASPLDPDKFTQQATTNVASDIVNDKLKQDQSIAAQKQLTAQAVQDQDAKTASDNQLRAQAGLPLIPQQPVQFSTDTASQVVPPSNQVSMAPPQTMQNTPAAGPSANLTGNFDKAMGMITEGTQKNAQLQSQGLAQDAAINAQYIQDQQKRQADFQVAQKAIQDQNTELFNNVRDSKIDPNRLWNNADTGQKIAAGLGLIFGGIGAGMTHSTNQAAEFLQKSIDRDVEAQKTDSSNNMNLYKLGLEKYKDAQSAEQFAQLQASTILAAKIQQTAQKIGSSQALAVAQQAIGELHMKYDPIRNDLALKQVALNYGQQQQNAPQQGVNTGKLNAFMNAGLYDPETKKDIIKEQGEYEKAKNLNDLTDQLFKQQTPNANYTNRIPGASHLPTFRDSTKEYNAATGAYLDKMTKDLTGRVTPQSMENLKTSLPIAGDSPEVTAIKRNAFKDLIKSGFTFPTLLNKGLLNPNDPVIQSSANIQNKFDQKPPVIK